MHLIALLLLSLLSCAALAETASETVGDIRVQALSPTLVRIEVRGPKGFEDRPTFHVVRRDWQGWKLTRKVAETTVMLSTSNWSVVIPTGAKSLAEVKITGKDGAELWAGAQAGGNSVWLPAPAETKRGWSFTDTPRLVPGKTGLAPIGNNSPNNGWDIDNDAPDVYVFLTNDYEKLRSDFLKLTGPIPMPPLYELGFVDSRYYAYHAQEALDRIDEYRRRKVPLDMFVVDTDWRMGGSHGYTPNAQYFPDMVDFLKKAHSKGVKIMFNDHPEPQAAGALDQAELGYRFNGLSSLLKEGVDVWWYDRNWNVGLVQPAPHLAREVWGMKLYHDVTQTIFPNRRPLIMTNVDGIDNGIRNRPPNVAAHRYPVQWTGDTRATYEYLRRGVENAVMEGVEGLNPWINEDLGGHVGRPTDDLYVRYLQFGSVSPMMRVHCTKGGTREPWAFGPEAEAIATDYIKMRYRLMPLFYTLAHEAYERGLPLLRRCDLTYMGKEAEANDQFLLGNDLLVAPIVGGHEARVAEPALFPKGLKAEYFASKDLSGDPKLIRTDANIDFDWEDNAPDPVLPSDNFSVRWTGDIVVPNDGKSYKLSVTGDDGVRLWIDGNLAIDHWEPQDSVTNDAAVVLPAGSQHSIRLEYFELTGGAKCRLRIGEAADADLSARSVWIPRGAWQNVWTGETITGPKTIDVKVPLSQMPMFLRTGAIIPTCALTERTADIDFAHQELEIVPGEGSIDLYNDDHESNAYTKGDSTSMRVRIKEQSRTTTVVIERPQGKHALGVSSILIAGRVASVKLDGKVVATEPGSGVLVKQGTRIRFPSGKFAIITIEKQ